MSEEHLVAAVVRELPQAIAVYLFGSLADGQGRPDSDLDIAVLLADEIPPLRRWEVQERLAAQLHRSVDLVDLGTASTVLRAQVIAHGRLLYESDGPRRRRMEGEALAAYARLNEERREVIDRIANEGRVHGR